MKKSATYLTVALILGSLTACSSPMNRDDAEAALKAAHEECVGKSLMSELPEVKLTFEATYSSLVYDYLNDSDAASNTVFVRCVSTELFGSDVTDNVHSREDKLSYEKSGYDASWLDDAYFSSRDLTWNKSNFFFARYDFGPSFYFAWYAPQA